MRLSKTAFKNLSPIVIRLHSNSIAHQMMKYHCRFRSFFSLLIQHSAIFENCNPGIEDIAIHDGHCCGCYYGDDDLYDADDKCHHAGDANEDNDD
jgi:hypothetical protein